MLRMRACLIFSIGVLLLIFSSIAFAQESRPEPSGSGGSTGGPGMSGQAVSAGMPESTTLPTNSGGTTGIRPGGGAGGTRPGQGGNTSGSGGQGGGLSSLVSGGGFTPPSGSGDAAARFGQRGTSTIQLPTGSFSFEAGGFGSGSQDGSAQAASNLETAPWHTSSSVPETPAAFSDLETVTQAQVEAQAAVEAAQGQASSSVDQATQEAQQAYDQFWTDYYAAVETTAQTYYDTVTASTDYMLESYEQAVDYAAQSVDYYVAYAEQYASYCAVYPWDCYSYSYDSSTNSYVYVGDTSSQPVSTTTLGEVTAATTYPVSPPTPSAEAYEAIVVFANDQLGAVVEPLYAGAATNSMETLMMYLPAEMQAYLLQATSISGESYWGLLNGGGAMVAVGDCTSGNCTVNADALSVQLSSASAGAYGIRANAANPTTSQEALTLITQVYPKLNGLAFAEISDIEQGFAFTATTASMGFDTTTRQSVSVAKVVYAGVVSVNNQPYIYALVALGEGYVNAMT